MRARLWLKRFWIELRRFLLIVIGTLIVAIGYVVFQIPFNIAAGGVSGIGIIVNHFTGFSVAAFYLLVNLPLFVLGFFALGGWRFLVNTVIAVLLFTAATEAIQIYLPLFIGTQPITTDPLLSAIFAGLIGGVGEGLVFAAGATVGGTGIIQNNLNNDGRVAPGNSIGTLTVANAYTQSSRGLLEIEINNAGTTPGVNVDHLVTDVANLGGTVHVVAAPGRYATGTQYDFLSANTINGTFEGITDNLAFLDAVLGYTASSAYFTLIDVHDYVVFADSYNTYNVGVYLDEISNGATGDLATLIDELDLVTNAEASYAL